MTKPHAIRVSRDPHFLGPLVSIHYNVPSYTALWQCYTNTIACINILYHKIACNTMIHDNNNTITRPALISLRRLSRLPRGAGAVRAIMANLRTKILDFGALRGVDSSRIICFTGGILTSMGNFLISLDPPHNNDENSDNNYQT